MYLRSRSTSHFRWQDREKGKREREGRCCAKDTAPEQRDDSVAKPSESRAKGATAPRRVSGRGEERRSNAKRRRRERESACDRATRGLREEKGGGGKSGAGRERARRGWSCEMRRCCPLGGAPWKVRLVSRQPLEDDARIARASPFDFAFGREIQVIRGEPSEVIAELTVAWSIPGRAHSSSAVLLPARNSRRATSVCVRVCLCEASSRRKIGATKDIEGYLMSFEGYSLRIKLDTRTFWRYVCD